MLNIRNGDSTVIMRRTAALGDVVSASVVADKLSALGYTVTFQAHPAAHCILRRIRSVTKIVEPTQGFVHVNLDGAYETNASRRSLHFHEMFVDRARAQLAPKGIEIGPALNCRPVVHVTHYEKEHVRERLKQYPRPWIFICPRSDSYNVRQVPDGVWTEAAAKMVGTKFWMGRFPSIAPKGIVDLKMSHFDDVILWLSVADLLVSVDTGPLHVGAAMGIPIVAILQSSSPELHLSDQRDFVTIAPKGLGCLNCQENICRINQHIPPCQNIDPEMIAQWANARVSARTGNGVAAIISVYRPDVATLNRCLECILPQVNEVILCRDQAGQFPMGMLQHQKIRVVMHRLKDIGYGRKQNYAARQSNQPFLLFMNDDVFLSPEAVARMLDVMGPKVGMTGNLLYYPDGTIQHAGKVRKAGERGWGHINWRQKEHTFRSPLELENICGACTLVRREAHFQVGGFDEEFYLYAEDDDYALKLRREGWQVWFTPYSTGIHAEHQSTNKSGNLMSFVNASNKIFDRKWGQYLTHNKDRVPGNFSYLEA